MAVFETYNHFKHSHSVSSDYLLIETSNYLIIYQANNCPKSFSLKTLKKSLLSISSSLSNRSEQKVICWVVFSYISTIHQLSENFMNVLQILTVPLTELFCNFLKSLFISVLENFISSRLSLVALGMVPSAPTKLLVSFLWVDHKLPLSLQLFSKR